MTEHLNVESVGIRQTIQFWMPWRDWVGTNLGPNKTRLLS
jgi:hypothetical protein